jgi:hydrogenase maturation factor
MKTSIQKVTPEYAVELIKRNGKIQRKLNKVHVDYLAHQMKVGQWQLTHQGIAVSKEGKILDGQHRLHAVVKANIPVDMLVSVDVPVDAFKVLDTGKNRGGGDVLSIAGSIRDPYLASAIVSGVLKSKTMVSLTGSGKSQCKITNTDILAYYTENKEEIEIVVADADSLYKKNLNVVTKGVAGFLMYLLYKKDQDLAYRLFESLLHEKEIAPIVTKLRHKLINNATAIRKMPRSVVVAHIVWVWNKLRSGETDAIRLHMAENLEVK